jgi:hypothetical protein
MTKLMEKYMTKYAIEKDVPMVDKVSWYEPIHGYPLDKLEIGESFLIPADDPRIQYCQRIVSEAGKRLRRKFITRTLKNHSVRVWRYPYPEMPF